MKSEGGEGGDSFPALEGFSGPGLEQEDFSESNC